MGTTRNSSSSSKIITKGRDTGGVAVRRGTLRMATHLKVAKLVRKAKIRIRKVTARIAAARIAIGARIVAKTARIAMGARIVAKTAARIVMGKGGRV